MVPDVRLRGLLTAVEWDEDGTPRRVALLTTDEGELEVAPEGVGHRLVEHVRCRAELRGRVEVCRGRPAMHVTSYDILQEDD